MGFLKSLPHNPSSNACLYSESMRGCQNNRSQPQFSARKVEIGTRFRRRRKEEGDRESTAGKRRAVCPQTARSAQHKTQTKRDKRQNPSHKQQGPGNKPQSSKPPRSVRHSRRRHEYRPTAARIGPVQSEPKSKPHLPFSPKPDRPLRPPWPESALRAGPYRPALVRSSQ